MMENQNPQGDQNFSNPYNRQQSNQQSGNPYQQGFNPHGAPNLPDVPNSTAILVLGIIGLVFGCNLIGVICSIIALAMAGKAITVYNQSPYAYSESSYKNIKAGRICAIIGLSIFVLTILIVAVALITDAVR